MDNIEKIRRDLRERGLDAVLINSYENRRYASGFTGSSGYVIVTGNDKILLTDSRYYDQAGAETPGFTIALYNLDILATLKTTLLKSGAERIGYEADNISDYEITRYKAEIPLSFTPVHEYLMAIRAVKEPEETVRIGRAAQISDAALEAVCRLIKPGVTEKEIAMELEYRIKKFGGEDMSFGTICASGVRSALPHGAPTDRKIEYGDMLTIDFGAKYDGYVSDMTRTLWVGKPDDEMAEIFHIVSQSQDDAFAALRPGIAGGELDAAHRAVFLRHNLDQYALRGLGHGVGLQIHEWPRASEGSNEILKENMVITIEPGLYIKGKGGVRTEDLAVITADGYRRLSESPRLIRV